MAFRSLTEGMDTTTPHRELLFHIFGALAQYERALTKERVNAGLAAAKKRGRLGGRPVALSPEKLEAVIAALNSGTTKAAVCRVTSAFLGARCLIHSHEPAGLAWRSGTIESP